MKKDDTATATAGAKLATQNDARVLAIALVIKLMGEGKRALAGQVLSLVSSELGIEQDGLLPHPPSPG